MGTTYTIILIAILIALPLMVRYFVNKNKAKNNENTYDEAHNDEGQENFNGDPSEQRALTDLPPYLVYCGYGSNDLYGGGIEPRFFVITPGFERFIRQFFDVAEKPGVNQHFHDTYQKLKKQKKAGKFEEKPDEIKTLINVFLEQIKVQMNSKMGEDERQKVNKTIELCEQLSTDNITDIDPEFFTSWIVSQSDANLVRDGLRTLKQVSDNYFENGKKELSFYISHLVLLRVKNIMHLVPEKEINEMFAPKGDQQPEFLQFISTLNPNEQYWNKLKEQSNGGGGNVITNRRKSKKQSTGGISPVFIF